jgi:tRNA(Ile)-lysidine synthase
MLEKILLDQCGLDPSRPVLAGISGGPDSLCLLGILQEAGYRVIVAHFNHQLRPEADLEAASVSDRARQLGLLFVTASADVHAYAEAQGHSIEEAARLLRYRFLFEAARKHKAQAVAVGHTADDQVETVLMHFVRGAGLAGLKGMEYRTILPTFDAEIPLVRPLLALWRTDTESYCQAHNLEAHFDLSNADTVFFRNSLRLSLIPELEKYNPQIKEALFRTAQALQGDYSVLQDVLQVAWKDVLRDTGRGWVAFDEAGLAGLSTGLRRNILRRAAELLRPDERDFGFEALERAASFIEKPSGRQVDLANGLYLFVENGRTTLAAYQADLPFAQWPQVKQQLIISSQIIATRDQHLELENGWILTAKALPLKAEDWSQGSDNWSVWLDADRLPRDDLVIRPRRRGDVFSPLGMGGQTVGVKDLYINLKIPRRARPHWPLVCAGDQVAWVVGYRIAHPFRITKATKRMLHLEIKRLPSA